MKDEVEALTYDLEQVERQLAQWRRKMRYESARVSGETPAHSQYEYHRKLVDRMRKELHELKMKQS